MLNRRGDGRSEHFAWWPLINTIDIAYAADQPFKFAWISDTHLYPESVYTRLVAKVKRAASEVQAMNPPADFLIFGGDLAQLGRANELALGVQLLSEIKAQRVFIRVSTTGITTWARSGCVSSTSPTGPSITRACGLSGSIP